MIGVVLLAHCAAANVPISKLKQLLVDVQSSMQAHQESERGTRETADTFLTTLSSTLSNEIAILEAHTRSANSILHKVDSQMNDHAQEAHRSSVAANDWATEAHDVARRSDQVGHQLDGEMLSVESTLAFLNNAVVTDRGILVTPEAPTAGQPAQLFLTIHRLLQSHPLLRTTSQGCARSLVDLFADTSNKVTLPCVREAIHVLSVIARDVTAHRSAALNQSTTQRSELEMASTQADTDSKLAAGQEAESAHNRQDVVFTRLDADAVLQLKEHFRAAVNAYIADRSTISKRITRTRMDINSVFQALLVTLDTITHPPSFLQIPHATQIRSLATLQAQIALAIQKHAGTHDLLQKLTAKLHQDTAHRLVQVEDLSASLHGLAKAFHDEKDKSLDITRLCVEEKEKAHAQTSAIVDGIHLMQRARKHTLLSLEAAMHSIELHTGKTQAAFQTFLQNHGTLVKQVDGYRTDTETYLLAFRKVLHVAHDKSNYIKRLAQLVTQQRDADTTFLNHEDDFLVVFAQYVKDEQILVWNRHKHAQESLAQLRLAYEDANGSTWWNDRALANARIVEEDVSHLCATILDSEAAERRTRRALQMKLSVLMPAIV